MANLQVKGIDASLYEEIKLLAKAESRSVSQQVLHLLKHWISNKKQFDDIKTPAETLLELSGSWQEGQDSKSADDIIADIKNARTNTDRFKEIF